ncbi:uncharacterized protein LOC135815945 isoform X2 [Sycon ciliatum]
MPQSSGRVSTIHGWESGVSQSNGVTCSQSQPRTVKSLLSHDQLSSPHSVRNTHSPRIVCVLSSPYSAPARSLATSMCPGSGDQQHSHAPACSEPPRPLIQHVSPAYPGCRQPLLGSGLNGKRPVDATGYTTGSGPKRVCLLVNPFVSTAPSQVPLDMVMQRSVHDRLSTNSEKLLQAQPVDRNNAIDIATMSAGTRRRPLLPRDTSPRNALDASCTEPATNNQSQSVASQDCRNQAPPPLLSRSFGSGPVRSKWQQERKSLLPYPTAAAATTFQVADEQQYPLSTGPPLRSRPEYDMNSHVPRFIHAVPRPSDSHAAAVSPASASTVATAREELSVSRRPLMSSPYSQQRMKPLISSPPGLSARCRDHQPSGVRHASARPPVLRTPVRSGSSSPGSRAVLRRRQKRQKVSSGTGNSSSQSVPVSTSASDSQSSAGHSSPLAGDTVQGSSVCVKEEEREEEGSLVHVDERMVSETELSENTSYSAALEKVKVLSENEEPGRTACLGEPDLPE